MSLLEKLKAAGSIKVTTLAESTLFNDKDLVSTPIPIINTAFSGRLDGGIVSGLTVAAGPSKHYKSLLGLTCVSAYLEKYPEAVCLFYDSEFGISPEYIASNGIDGNRVIHIPVMHIEELKFDIMKRLEQIDRKDKVFILIDSLGNLASKKEIEDALDEKSVADMTRAKQGKSLFRMITPHLTTKDIPCFAIAHTYETMEMFSKQVVSGGKGIYYSAQTIFIVGRSQEKEGTEVTGWNFTLNIEKSRFVKEKSKLVFQVMYDGGINIYSGLLDLALESGHVTKPKNGWYTRPGIDVDKNFREKDTNTKEFWSQIVNDEGFKGFVKNKFMLTSNRHPVDVVEGEDDDV
jgi:RecA/RadA recombinase